MMTNKLRDVISDGVFISTNIPNTVTYQIESMITNYTNTHHCLQKDSKLYLNQLSIFYVSIPLFYYKKAFPGQFLIYLYGVT